MAIYEAAEEHFKEYPCIFHRIIRTDGMEYGINWHDELEIVYCREGEGRICIDGEMSPFRQGDIVLFNQKVMHDIYSDTRCDYFCVIFSKNFIAENGLDLSLLKFKERIPFDKTIVEAITGLWDEDYRPMYDVSTFSFTVPDPFRMVRIRRHLTDILFALCSGYVEETVLHNSKGEAGLTRVKNVINYINEHRSENISLSSLSARFSINKYQLAREFKKYTNMTVVRYYNVIRCRAAKYMLMEGCSVADAGNACGFGSMSYFTRVYTECIGERPSVTRERINHG